MPTESSKWNRIVEGAVVATFVVTVLGLLGIEPGVYRIGFGVVSSVVAVVLLVWIRRSRVLRASKLEGVGEQEEPRFTSRARQGALGLALIPVVFAAALVGTGSRNWLTGREQGAEPTSTTTTTIDDEAVPPTTASPPDEVAGGDPEQPATEAPPVGDGELGLMPEDTTTTTSVPTADLVARAERELEVADDPAAALALMDAVLADAPEEPAALQVRAEALRRLANRWSELEEPVRRQIDASVGGVSLDGTDARAALRREALDAINTALVIDDQVIERHVVRAAIHVNAQQWRPALDAVAAGLELGVQHPELHFWQGVARFHLNELEPALDSFDEALLLDGSEPRYVEWKGWTYRQQGKTELGLEAARAAVDTEAPLASSYVLLGLLLDDDGDVPGAEQAFDTALSIDEDNVDALIGKVDLVTERHGTRAALGYLNALVDSRGDTTALIEQKAGELELVLRQLPDALESFETSISLKSAAPAWKGKGDALRRLIGGCPADRDCVDEAVAAYEMASELDSDWIWPHIHRGRILLFNKSDPRGGLEAFEAALATGSQIGLDSVWDGIGDALRLLFPDCPPEYSCPSDTVAAYDEAISISPEWSSPHFWRARVLLEQQYDPVAALPGFEQAAKLNEGWASPLAYRGDALRLLGLRADGDDRSARFAEARTAYADAEGIAPGWTYPAERHAALLLEDVGDAALALEVIEAAEFRGAASAVLYEIEARAHRREGDLPEAARAYEAAIALAPDDADLLRGRGSVEMDLGDHPAAIESFREALDKAGQLTADESSVSYLHRYLAEAYEAGDRHEEAVAAYEQHLEIYDEDGWAMVALARLLDQPGTEDRARALIEDAIEAAPAPASGRLFDFGYLPEAERAVRKALDADPASYLHTRLIDILVAAGDLPLALEAADEAIRTDPDGAATHWADKGELLYTQSTEVGDEQRRLELLAAAEEALTTSIDIEPSASAHYRRAVNVHLQLPDRQPDALRDLDAALDLAPRHSSAHWERADLLGELNGAAATRAYYDDLIDEFPDWDWAHGARGFHYRGHDDAEALAAYEEAIRLSSDWGWPRWAKGTLLLYARQDHDGALTAFQSAVRVAGSGIADSADLRALVALSWEEGDEAAVDETVELLLDAADDTDEAQVSALVNLAEEMNDLGYHDLAITLLDDVPLRTADAIRE